MKPKFILSALISPLMVAALTGCGKTSLPAAHDADFTATDSAMVELYALPPMLPDTAYESVSLIKPKTVVLDTATTPIINSTANLYASAPGFLTFRGGAYRDANFHGTVKGEPTKIDVDWEFTTDQSRSSEKMGSWGGGSGWTGQPLYINWPDSCVAKFKAAGVINDNFHPQEIIVGSLAGRVYFIDYASGKASRKSVDVVNVIKGTVSLDPTLNGNLYVGQGIPLQRPFGSVVIDLYKGEVTHTYGEDPKAPRQWGAYDSSALRVGQFLFRPGENGTLYKFSIAPGSLKLHSYMSYTTGRSLGMEASMSAYANYGFTADNHGMLICTNLNTMRPVWCYNLGDDTDSSPVLLIEDSHPYIYVGSEIDKQNVGNATLVKIDALNGKPVWVNKFEGRLAEVGSKHFDGGFYGTILPGSGNCSDLMFANLVRNTRGQNGEFIAFEKSTGKVRYAVPLKYYAWSSPVGFLNEKDEMYIVTADCSGRVYLIKGSDGTIIYNQIIGNNFESSPVVIGNTLVVGSRGNKIFRMSVN